jgi:catechol-2,3-dioxygenase
MNARTSSTIAVRRLNHAVLYVRDVEQAVAFYERVLGLEVVARAGGAMAFMRAPGSSNHHDLGLARVGANAPSPPPGSVGLYHLAWEVERIDDLAIAFAALQERDALTGASDHGATKSVYGIDPDGNEFEVMWLVPRERWGEFEHSAPTRRLDLPAEIARWGGSSA